MELQTTKGSTIKSALKSALKSLINLLPLLAPFFFWGTAMVAMKGVIPHTTPMFMAGFRLVPAGVLVLLAAMLMGLPQPKSGKAWLWIVLFAVVDGTMFQGFLAAGLVRTGAGLGSVMIDSQPLAVALLSAWLFGEVIGVVGAVGLAIGIVGIGSIGLPDRWIIGWLHGENLMPSIEMSQLFQNGAWWMLLAALCMAVGTVMMHWVAREADPVVATGWHMILGGLPLWLLSVTTESEQWVNINWDGWLALAYATVFGSAIAYGLFFYFAAKGNLTSLSALTFLTPVFALLFGNVFLSETLSGVQSIGVGLTLVSIYSINQREAIAEKLKFNQSNAAGEYLSDKSTREKLHLSFPEENPTIEVPLEVLNCESD
jgi:drug/metabolite transporter (DMT)-like permease